MARTTCQNCGDENDNYPNKKCKECALRAYKKRAARREMNSPALT